MKKDTIIIWLIVIILTLMILLALSQWQNERILDGWRQAQEYWQGLPLIHPEVGN